MKKGDSAVRVYTREDYDLICTKNCYYLGFQEEPIRLNEEFTCQNGEVLKVGDKIQILGEAGSAGYPNIHMHDGDYLVYTGKFVADGEDGEEDKFLLFDAVMGGDLMEVHPDYEFGWWALQELDSGDIMFTTPGAAGRVIRTTKLVRVPEEV